MPRPRVSYIVCSTPGSGSTLLCRALAATGVAGLPEEGGTTPNGVFGAEVIWGGVPAQGGGEPHYVWVTRRDRIRQAVSLWKALQTHAARYSFPEVDHLRRQLTAHDRAWMTHFDSHNIEPLVLTYEQIMADLPGAVRAVLGHLGLDLAAADRISPVFEREPDARSEEWVELYERDSSPATV
jgi:LPS sulfotransferase NodH